MSTTTPPALKHPLRWWPAAPLALVWTICATAAPAAQLCPAQPYRFAPIVSDLPQGPEDETYASADRSNLNEDGSADLGGNVNIRRGKQQLAAQRVHYDRNSGQADAYQGVAFSDGDMLLEGDELHLNLNTEAGTLENASYALRERRTHGKARRIIRHDGSHYTLEKTSYSGCPPGHDDWTLTASKVDLDTEKAVGVARNAVLRFKGVPLVYTPWYSFPLNDARKSGLLTPTIGNSRDTGFDLSQPYYWNIAPNYDAIITPRYMSKRGLMVESTARYLRPTFSGEVSGSFLGGDNKANRDRGSLFWQQRGRLLGSRISYSLDYNKVSDNQYFEDFGADLADVNEDHLLRQALVTYHGSNWTLATRFQGYQTIKGSVPYKRLPEVSFRSDGVLDRFGLDYDLGAEVTYFDHDTLVDGSRVDLHPRLSYPIRRPGWFVEPALALRYTAYSLNNQLAGRAASPDRFTPIVSLDSGLFFERDTNIGGLGLVQTLEPRAYYLYVPNRNQDDIPLFDTTLLDFGFDQLFRENRFSGPDRQGDANQLTLALTSRMLNNRYGTELLRASVGQIIYFKDRKVRRSPTLPKDNDPSSEVVTGLAAKLTRNLNLRADWQWDPQLHASAKTTYGIFYRPGEKRILNLTYRSRRGVLEQTDASFAWPLTRQWRLVGRNNYSLRDNQNLETFGGLEFSSCCYTVRGLYRRYVRNTAGEFNEAFMVQIEFRGLGSLGNRVDEFLSEGILGYPLPEDNP